MNTNIVKSCYLLWMYRRVSKSYWFNNNSSVSPFEARFSPSIVERKPKQDPEKRFPLFRSRIFFLSIPSFFLVFTSPFSHHLIFHFCLCVCGSGGVFFRCGMTSMTEMARATSPSSAFAATAFGASSSSVRLRYQTVGPLYVCQAGWATLPHSYYALDYCSPK